MYDPAQWQVEYLDYINNILQASNNSNKHETSHSKWKKKEELEQKRHTQQNTAIHGGRLRHHFKLWPDMLPIHSDREIINKNFKNTQFKQVAQATEAAQLHIQVRKLVLIVCPRINAQFPTQYKQICRCKLANCVDTRRSSNIWWVKDKHSKLNSIYSLRVEDLPKSCCFCCKTCCCMIGPHYLLCARKSIYIVNHFLLVWLHTIAVFNFFCGLLCGIVSVVVPIGYNGVGDDILASTVLFDDTWIIRVSLTWLQVS